MKRISTRKLVALFFVLLFNLTNTIWAAAPIKITINNDTDYIFNILLLIPQEQGFDIKQLEIDRRTSQTLATTSEITIEFDIQNVLGTGLNSQADAAATWIVINKDYTLNTDYEVNKKRPYNLIYNQAASNLQLLVFDIESNAPNA